MMKVGIKELRKYLERGWYDCPVPDHSLEDVTASFDALTAIDDLDQFIAERTEKNPKFSNMVKTAIASGDHLGEIRKWMQWRFVNGDRVTWGSEEFLSGTSLTVREMEELAQRIRDASVRELFRKLKGEMAWMRIHAGLKDGDE